MSSSTAHSTALRTTAPAARRPSPASASKARPESQQWGQIQVGYNSANERVEIPYVRVIKADGTVVKAGDDAVQDLSAPLEQQAPVYTDYRVKHITVPGLRPGEVLEYRVVTVIHTPLAPGEFWTDYDFDKTNIDLDEEVDVDVPASRPLKLKTKPGMDPKISDQDGRRLYHWTNTHLQREDDKKDKDKINDKKKKKTPDDDRPDIQLTSFVSWEQIGRWYASLEKDRRAPSPEVRAKAAELTKGLNTDLDKVQALYDFVAKNFRYVSLSLGVGRYQPHAASDVLHNQYGDCKDKHTLLASLLEAEGMHASSVLINSSRKLDPDVPSPSQFDHVITLLPDDQAQRRSLDGHHQRSGSLPSSGLQPAQKASARDPRQRHAAFRRDSCRYSHARQ